MYANGEDVLKSRHVSKITNLDLVAYEKEFPEKWLHGDDIPDNLSVIIGSCDNDVKEQLACAIYSLVRDAAIEWGDEPDDLWKKERNQILYNRAQYHLSIQTENDSFLDRAQEAAKVHPVSLDTWEILFKKRIKGS